MYGCTHYGYSNSSVSPWVHDMCNNTAIGSVEHEARTLALTLSLTRTLALTLALPPPLLPPTPNPSRSSTWAAQWSLSTSSPSSYSPHS